MEQQGITALVQALLDLVGDTPEGVGFELNLLQFYMEMRAKFYAVAYKHNPSITEMAQPEYTALHAAGCWQSETMELTEALEVGRNVGGEAVDVANTAFMIWWRDHHDNSGAA